MNELSIKLYWQRSEAELAPGKYTNSHIIMYNDHNKVIVDAAPDWGGSIEHTNPEQALAAALSSCHMMTFLALSAKAKWPVLSFSDHAIAHLGKNSKGRMSVTQIDLHPDITFDDGFSVGEEKLKKMQERAHNYCFIANTLADSVKVNINS